VPICKQYHIHKNTFSEIGVYNFNFSTNNAEIGKTGSVNLQIATENPFSGNWQQNVTGRFLLCQPICLCLCVILLKSPTNSLFINLLKLPLIPPLFMLLCPSTSFWTHQSTIDEPSITRKNECLKHKLTSGFRQREVQKQITHTSVEANPSMTLSWTRTQLVLAVHIVQTTSHKVSFQLQEDINL
jgi:hypothetical protein